MNVLLTVLIGTVSGIISAMIIFLLSNLYKFRSKQNIQFNINMAIKYSVQIDANIDYPNNYEMVIHCIEELNKHLFNINDNIYPFSKAFKFNQKKFLKTLLYDCSQRCENAIFTEVGYSGYLENESRLVKIEKEFNNSTVINDGTSLIMNQLILIKYLNSERTLKKAIKEFEEICTVNNYNKLIYRTSFNNATFSNYIQNKGLTQNEYKKLLHKYMGY